MIDCPLSLWNIQKCTLNIKVFLIIYGIQSVEKQLLSLTRRLLADGFYISEEKGVMYMKILQDAMDNLPLVLPMRNSLVETIGEDFYILLLRKIQG